jgi:hypothetical protein
MSINPFNLSFNKRNDFFFSNYTNNDLDSSFNLDENSININNNQLISFDLNNFNTIFDENSLKNNNLYMNPTQMINKAKPYFKIKKYYGIKIENDIPKPFLEKDITKLFKKMNICKETKMKFISCINNPSTKKEEIKSKLLLNPRERRKKLNDKVKPKEKKEIKFNNKSNLKSGRKTKNDFSVRTHNKFSFDNMIDKIKNMINTSLVLFCNKIIKAIYINEEQIIQIFSMAKISKEISRTKIIKDIDYSFLANKRKGNEVLELLNMTVKDYLSNKISSKYVNIPNEYNELIINQLLLDDNNKDIFVFLFNIKIGDFFYVYIYQKDIKDFLEFNNLNSNHKRIIKNNLVRINDCLNKIVSKDETYFQCLVMLIYNFRRFLMNQERRNRN